MSAMDLSQLHMDVNNLYREESYTDLKMGTIHRLMPVKADGTADTARKAIYSGRTTIMSGAGPVPLDFEIAADSLETAISKFPEAAKGAVEQLIAEAKEYQRQQAGRIIVPDARQAGKIQLG